MSLLLEMSRHSRRAACHAELWMNWDLLNLESGCVAHHDALPFIYPSLVYTVLTTHLCAALYHSTLSAAALSIGC